MWHVLKTYSSLLASIRFCQWSLQEYVVLPQETWFLAFDSSFSCNVVVWATTALHCILRSLFKQRWDACPCRPKTMVVWIVHMSGVNPQIDGNP